MYKFNHKNLKIGVDDGTPNKILNDMVKIKVCFNKVKLSVRSKK